MMSWFSFWLLRSQCSILIYKRIIYNTLGFIKARMYKRTHIQCTRAIPTHKMHMCAHIHISSINRLWTAAILDTIGSAIYRSNSIITYTIKLKILLNIIKKYDDDWCMNLKQINMEITVSFSDFPQYMKLIVIFGFATVYDNDRDMARDCFMRCSGQLPGHVRDGCHRNSMLNTYKSPLIGICYDLCTPDYPHYTDDLGFRLTMIV